jgi:hypothetical protein
MEKNKMSKLATKEKSDLEYQVDDLIKIIESGTYECEDENGPNAFDFINIECLDINYIINSDKTYRGARLLYAFGGPNIWIDTLHGQVEGYWGGETIIKSYYQDLLYLDEACEDLYS